MFFQDIKLEHEKKLCHYNKEFFEWQKKTGELSGILDTCKFKKYIKLTDKVIDFGCGGGFMLKSLNCSSKIGLEINPIARDFARTNGIVTVEDTSEIENEWADVIISDNVLEHTLCPYIELQNLGKKLKSGGKIVFVVPHEKRMSWKPNDINQHLYTWSPLCIGNLFTKVGFNVEEISNLPIWPPRARIIRKYFGSKILNIIGKIYTSLSGQWCQVRIVASKPK